MKFTEHPHGHLAQSGSAMIFFGNRQADLKTLQSDFPQLNFRLLNQVHSNIVVKASDAFPASTAENADAHWLKNETHIALAIKTADCMPLFIYDQVNKLIAGVHAGWRGVAGKIFANTIHSLQMEKSNLHGLQIFVGPHITDQSFVVDADVKDQILASANVDSCVDHEKYAKLVQNNKFIVNLYEILCKQALDLEIQPTQIHKFCENTVENMNYHSFRRDRESSGRQLSFICII